jgi:hypothetical protein
MLLIFFLCGVAAKSEANGDFFVLWLLESGLWWRLLLLLLVLLVLWWWWRTRLLVLGDG